MGLNLTVASPPSPLLSPSGDCELSIIPVTDDIAERAAFLRARYNIKTPDALQLATALLTGGKFFLTNDESLSSVEEIHVLILDRIV